MLSMMLALASPAPSQAPSPDTTLPEIGRVRAVTPACSVLHDLVLPAAQISRRADTRFLDVAKRLPDYVQSVSSDPEGRTSPLVEMRLSRLDQTTSLIVRDVGEMAKILADPRLAPDSGDPLVRQERAALQRMYEAQMTRVSNISEFVARQGAANGRAEVDQLAAQSGQPTPSPTPLPFASSAPDNLPTLTGIDLRDAEAFRGWSQDLTAIVRRSEVDAARSLGPIARVCE
jgi:hypothetical protein